MEINDKIKFREELKQRLKRFVLELIKLCQEIPYSRESDIIIKQLLRSGSSVYANYRAANRARSKAEFFSKLSIVVEEADETEMWLELLIDSNIKNSKETIRLHNESLEILKIMASARKNSQTKSTNQ
jgi:four helix bundle protein